VATRNLPALIFQDNVRFRRPTDRNRIGRPEFLLKYHVTFCGDNGNFQPLHGRRNVWHSGRPTSWIKGLVKASIDAETLIHRTEIRTSRTTCFNMTFNGIV
jgi:hypothetical protein